MEQKLKKMENEKKLSDFFAGLLSIYGLISLLLYILLAMIFYEMGYANGRIKELEKLKEKPITTQHIISNNPNFPINDSLLINNQPTNPNATNN